MALASGSDSGEASNGARLLAAVRSVFDGHEVMASAELVKLVNGDEEAPFGAWREGRGLDARLLAKLLRPYGVRPATVRLGDATAKGYRREQFEDPWTRYLDTPSASATEDEEVEADRVRAKFEVLNGGTP
jgi:hypothetical protein